MQPAKNNQSRERERERERMRKRWNLKYSKENTKVCCSERETWLYLCQYEESICCTYLKATESQTRTVS